MSIKVDETLCSLCGECMRLCPIQAIIVLEKVYIDENTCIECGICADACPLDAITNIQPIKA